MPVRHPLPGVQVEAARLRLDHALAMGVGQHHQLELRPRHQHATRIALLRLGRAVEIFGRGIPQAAREPPDQLEAEVRVQRAEELAASVIGVRVETPGRCGCA